MFLNAIAHYLPSQVITNSYFLDKNGLSDEWIFSRTGIKERRKAESDENANTMAIEAVKRLIDTSRHPIHDVDLIIGASYTPFDSVATLAHKVQQYFNISNVRTVYISTACSSFINALEITEGYFATGKAKKALIVLAEHNTLYSNESDEMAGHLWGDASAAVLVSNNRTNETDIEVLDLFTEGLANVGKGTDGVWLQLKNEGLKMPFGKDVFLNACTYMAKATMQIMSNNHLALSDMDYFIPHQANTRIINNVAEELKIPAEKTITNIERLGNTGCVSTVIGLSENIGQIGKNKRICITVFGGGYSGGAVLLRT
jgi:3-oxoacyl-[acyl-carrier-protein] synthase III